MTRVQTQQLDKIEGITHTNSCSVVTCRSEGEVTVNIPNYGLGRVETVTLCQTCHEQYDIQYWV